MQCLSGFSCGRFLRRLCTPEPESRMHQHGRVVPRFHHKRPCPRRPKNNLPPCRSPADATICETDGNSPGETGLAAGFLIRFEVLYFSGAVACSSESSASKLSLWSRRWFDMGSKVATIDAASGWSGSDLKRALRPFLAKGVAIMALVSQGGLQLLKFC